MNYEIILYISILSNITLHITILKLYIIYITRLLIIIRSMWVIQSHYRDVIARSIHL